MLLRRYPHLMLPENARVMRAVKILTDSRAGVRLKASKVTVSTVGLVPAIERFCTDPENGASLAISLHTVSDEVRDQVQKKGGSDVVFLRLIV